MNQKLTGLHCQAVNPVKQQQKKITPSRDQDILLFCSINTMSSRLIMKIEKNIN